MIAEANHRIANNLSLIASLVRLHAEQVGRQTRQMSAREIRLLLEEVAGRITVIGELHRLLSGGARPAAAAVGDYLREVCAAQAASLSYGGHVEVSVDTTTCPVDPERVVPVALIVSEVFTNAIKYAHPTGVAGRIAVTCRAAAGGALVIEIADDGVGLPEGFDPETDGGVGLKIVRSLSRQLNARHEFDSTDCGLRFRLTIPAGRAAP